MPPLRISYLSLGHADRGFQAGTSIHGFSRGRSYAHSSHDLPTLPSARRWPCAAASPWSELHNTPLLGDKVPQRVHPVGHQGIHGGIVTGPATQPSSPPTQGQGGRRNLLFATTADHCEATTQGHCLAKVGEWAVKKSWLESGGEPLKIQRTQRVHSL